MMVNLTTSLNMSWPKRTKTAILRQGASRPENRIFAAPCGVATGNMTWPEFSHAAGGHRFVVAWLALLTMTHPENRGLGSVSMNVKSTIVSRRLQSRGALGLTIVVVLLMAATRIRAQEPNPKWDGVTAEVVDALVEQLDDDSLSRRREASQQLTELGPQVLRFLPPNRSTDSPERSEALIRIRRELEIAVATQLKNPSRVTVQGALTLWEALEVIEGQTGNGFGRLEIETPKVELSLDQVTYWEAITELLRQFPEFRLHPFRTVPGQLQWLHQPGGQNASSSVTQQGVFLMEALRMEAISDLSNPAVDATIAVIRIRWEPRLKPLSIVHDLKALRGITNQDNRLLSTGGQERLETPVQSGTSWVDFRATMEKASRVDQFLKELSGSLLATLPAVETKFRFEDLDADRPQEQRTGETVVTFMGVKKVNQLQAVQVRVRFDESSGSLESHRQWLFESPAYLLDAEGKTINYFTFETTLQRSDEVGIAYLFGIDGELQDYIFEYRAPSAILTIKQDWSIQDLPLP
jgi:hypothetical protein